ncbi:MAG: hypothetical protein U0414_01745 [Polyangiaceae bacterium]
MGGIVGSQGCGPSEAPVIDCSTTTAKKYGELAIWAKCTTCHSTQRTGDKRHGATIGYDYDTPSGAKATASEAQDDVAGVGLNPMPPHDQVLDDGSDPPDPTEAEKTEFYTWVQCGQPI